MPYIQSEYEVAARTDCRCQKMICELMDFMTQVVGTSVIPSACIILIFNFEGILFRVMKSLLSTSAKAQSELRALGSVKLRKRELETIGLFKLKRTWVTEIEKSQATEVNRILVLYSIAYELVGSLYCSIAQWEMTVQSMDIPLTTTEQSVLEGSLAVLARVMVRMLRLLLGEQLRIGTMVPLLQVIVHKLVDTDNPNKFTTNTLLTSISWKVLNCRVQQVLVTPREFSLQVNARDFITPVQKIFWFWLMNSLYPSIEPVLSISEIEWYGRSSEQGNFMLSKRMLKAVEQAPVVLKGMQVRQEVDEILMVRGICYMLLNWGLTEAREVLDKTEVESQKGQLERMMRAVLQELPLKEPEGATVRLMFDLQAPARPAMLNCMVLCLGLEQTRILTGVSWVVAPLVGIGAELRQVMAPLFVSIFPIIIQKGQALMLVQRVGMMILNLEVLSVPGSTMLMRSQLRGYCVVKFCEFEPWMQVQVAARLLAQGQVLQLLRVVNKLVHP